MKCAAQRTAGYVIALPAQRELNQPALDDLQRRLGESRVNSALDGLWNNDGDLYQGDDGNFYAVEFDYSVSPAVPLAWAKLTKADE